MTRSLNSRYSTKLINLQTLLLLNCVWLGVCYVYITWFAWLASLKVANIIVVCIYEICEFDRDKSPKMLVINVSPRTDGKFSRDWSGPRLSGSGMMMTDNEVTLLLLLLLLLQLLHHLLTISFLSFSFGPLHIRSHPENPISRSASEGSSSGYSTEGDLE